MKVMIIGDTHCDADFAQQATAEARRVEVEAIVQVGDFGYRFDKPFIKVWQRWLEDVPAANMFWLAGNHDDYDYIEDSIDGFDGDVPVPHWHERMLYCPRGSVTTLGDTRVMFVGGGYSIDKARRRPHESWWEQEMITDDDVAKSIRNGVDIDVMFTHDSPNNDVLYGRVVGYKDDTSSADNRAQLDRVVAAVRPKMVIHGHYHQRYTSRAFGAQIEGLAANVVYDRMRSGYIPPRENVNYVIMDM